ncbi:MAG TPA: SOS response-associated peptidase family protein [Rhizomicrobium sp.]|nr:SOS response-associated peptidase family protein [Rhizomicrobium sp.]
MCGKFTAMASWAEMVAIPQPPAIDENKVGEDREVAFRVMTNLPIILFDKSAGRRRVVPMRWGFPHPNDWRRPQPLHARSETIDTTRAFADAFRDGQRGIVLMRTFNEAPDVEGPTVQHTIAPGDDGVLAAAFLWRRFAVPDQQQAQPQPMFACVMVTVPANALLTTLPTDRMPAFIAPDDWALWLDEEPASLEEVKACLKTVDGARWRMSREERAKAARRARPTVSDPGGLF